MAITYEEIRDYINGKETGNGCRLLTTEQEFTEEKIKQGKSNVIVKIIILCQCENTFITNFDKFKNGNKKQCNNCSKNNAIKKQVFNYNDVKTYIENNSECKLLSTNYIGYHSNLKLKCKCGNEFFVSLAQFKSKNQRQCIDCSNKLRSKKQALDYNDVKKYIEIDSGSGCKLLSSEYINMYEKMKFKCKCGNEFETSFTVFKNKKKYQCDKCSGTYHMTYDEVKDEFKNLGYELIDKTYNNTLTPITFKDKDGYYYYSTLSILKRTNSSKFHISNPYTIQNIKLWCKLNNKSFELISEKYISVDKDKLKWKCLKENCGEIFEMTWANIENGKGCSYCAGKKVGKSNCLATKNPELIKEWHSTKNGNLTPYNVTYAANKDIFWKCEKCGHEWKTKLTCRSLNHSGCPICNESRGEKRIQRYLDDNKIVNISQYSFNNLYGDTNLLRFDFAVFNNNSLLLLIEYDGEFHYKRQYKTDGYEKLIKYDHKKNKYCDVNNIRLLRIPYWEFDNIEKILDKELNINQDKKTA